VNQKNIIERNPITKTKYFEILDGTKTTTEKWPFIKTV
jgi:hypothetical protein